MQARDGDRAVTRRVTAALVNAFPTAFCRASSISPTVERGKARLFPKAYFIAGRVEEYVLVGRYARLRLFAVAAAFCLMGAFDFSFVPGLRPNPIDLASSDLAAA